MLIICDTFIKGRPTIFRLDPKEQQVLMIRGGTLTNTEESSTGADAHNRPPCIRSRKINRIRFFGAEEAQQIFKI
jgi:hypothetical protein